MEEKGRTTVHCNSESETTCQQLAEEHSCVDVETHPHYVGYVNNLCGSPVVNGGKVLIKASELLLRCEEQMDYYLETQYNALNVNKIYVYLTLLASIGLDSPRKSCDSGMATFKLYPIKMGESHNAHTKIQECNEPFGT